jgi:hypothetical protein
LERLRKGSLAGFPPLYPPGPFGRF